MTDASFRHHLETADDALLAVQAAIATGDVPRDEVERDRCRLVAERLARKGRGVVDLLARPPAGSPAAPSLLHHPSRPES